MFRLTVLVDSAVRLAENVWCEFRLRAVDTGDGRLDYSGGWDLCRRPIIECQRQLTPLELPDMSQ
ncbi:hypothetical protein [Halioxenophilus sp. WMMB6]|uniref:hypothetical protein n=1 Tax=Halioxenophilus sp. WMMB6 TaxID=3073815 RepID=UPI00295E33D6|nr:hypothetical protein [Halioxenophilus sp. WMMB6]